MHNTLIVYASKNGTTEKCAYLLAEQLHGQVDTLNLKTNQTADWDAYDTVVIGGPIYAGSILKEVAAFCQDNLNMLTQKNLGLFICGLQEDETIEKELAASFPQELQQKAITKSYFGGELYFSKMGRFERWMMKKMAKSEEDISELRTDNIETFAETLNNL